MRKQYKILKDRSFIDWKTNEITETYIAGTIVYMPSGYDYGCASDDTRETGIEHISVTLDSEGGYPCFTIPLNDLEQMLK